MKPKKWIPKIGEKYWSVWMTYSNTVRGMVDVYHYRRFIGDQTFNCFKTKKLALEAARKIRKVLS
jgi:hypothetical protein